MGAILERSGLAAALLLMALPAATHHSRTIFDQDRIITIEGVVTKYEWANPHVYLYVEAETEAGDAVVWALESGVTTLVRRQGWSSNSFVPGDRVIVQANPPRDSRRNTALVVSVQKAGVTLSVRSARIAPAPDEHELSPVKADGLSGTWEVPSSRFVAHFSVPSSWSLTTKGAEAVEIYDDRTMNPQIQCTARTAPWLMIFSGVHKIEIGDTLISIRTEYDTVERTVHMDLASHDGAAITHQGHSIGWWEDEVLVVDTTHFSDHRSGNARGVQSGSQKHLVERFELNPDRTSLTYRFELEDPEYLAAPVTGELTSAHRPDLEFAPIACDLENAARYVGD